MPIDGGYHWQPGESKEAKRDRAKKWRAHVDRGGRRKKGKRGR